MKYRLRYVLNTCLPTQNVDICRKRLFFLVAKTFKRRYFRKNVLNPFLLIGRVCSTIKVLHSDGAESESNDKQTFRLARMYVTR